jgi:2-oxoglutarate-Fe(II)-dependent oxygenase superfamily protein
MIATEQPASHRQPFFFDSSVLDDLTRRHAAAYAEASPFPHAVMDDFLPAWVGRGILEEFPAPGQIDWRQYDDPNQKKLANENESKLGPFTRHVIAQLNSSTFVSFLERLTGIEGLIPDPHLRGGGLHQIQRGGLLKVHADFNWYPRLKLDRRLNLLFYLNEDWQEDYGGHLELWDREMARCERRVLPVFNRCVVFNTTDTAFHGHPEPLTCPEGRTRKSLALYYYSNGRPAEETASPHSTQFKKRPSERGWLQGLRELTKRLGGST